MDQALVASLALVAFAVFVVVAFILNEERKSRKRMPPDVLARADNIHSGPDDVEKRARRAF